MVEIKYDRLNQEYDVYFLGHLIETHRTEITANGTKKIILKTIELWENSGKLIAIRTEGGHRRYKLSDIEKILGENDNLSSDNKKEIIDKATEVFAEILVELCPELLGYGAAAKGIENEFRKRLENKL